MRRFLFLALLGGCASQFSLTPKDDDDPDSDDDVPSSGADIRVSPGFLDFRSVLPGCPSEPQLVTITNVGDAPLRIEDVLVSGPARRAFSVDPPRTTIDPGESTEARITFSPDALGTYDEAMLVVESSDADEGTVEVPLEGEGANEVTIEDTFTQKAPSGVDLLVLLDTSSSMEQDVEDLRTHFATFVNSFLRLGLDFHLGVMPIDHDCPWLVGPVVDASTADPAAAFQEQLAESMCNDNETTFEMITAAFTPPNLGGRNAGFLRTDANLAVVVFTDEPEQSGSLLNPYDPSAFVRFLKSLKGGDASKVTFSGLVGPDTIGGATNCLVRGNPALWNDRYQKAIRQSNGYVGNICDVRVQPFLRLLERTATGLSYTFELSRTPSSVDLDDWEVLVDGVAVPSGWSYDAATQSIVFETDAVPAPGASVQVFYPHAASECP